MKTKEQPSGALFRVIEVDRQTSLLSDTPMRKMLIESGRDGCIYKAERVPESPRQKSFVVMVVKSAKANHFTSLFNP